MYVHHMTVASPFIRQGISSTLWKASSLTKPLYQQRTVLLRQVRNHVTKTQKPTKPTNFSANKVLLLSFSFPALFRKSTRLTRDDIGSVDLAIIPKEVYVDDLKAKAKQRQSQIKIFFYKLWSIVRMSLRSWSLLLTFTPFMVTYPLTYVSTRFYKLWLHALLFVCERSGPTLVKFGQWASTRRDLFTKEFCDRFSKLHRRTNPHPWCYTREKLEKAFGKNWKHVLVRIDDKETPLGSGCVAQVYKAYMPSEMVVDDDVLEEILADIDDQNTPDHHDSFEILGFSSFFRWSSPDQDQDEKDERPTLFSEWQPCECGEVVNPEICTMTLTSETVNGGTFKFAFSKSKQHVPALSSRSEKNAREEKIRIEKEAEMRERMLCGEDPDDDSMTDMEVAVQDGLVPVAVKVLHPGIYRAVKRDLSILRCVAAACELLFPTMRWLSVRDCVEEFADIMERQIDLRHEAECLENFYENFEDVPNVRFPRPVRPFVKRNVLVETFEEGEPISNFLDSGGVVDKDDEEAAERMKDIGQRLADIGADALLKMIFIDNLIHGDLHPGNILVQNAQDYYTQDESRLTLVDICDTTVVSVHPADCTLRLVLLDVGITSSLSDADKEAFHNVFLAVVLGQGEKVGDLLLDHATKHECPDRQKFVKEIASIVSEAREKTIKLGKMQVGDLLSNVFTVLTRHRVKLESNFLSVILAIMVLEGLGRSLDPDMDILEKAKPILRMFC